jgi:hypothetical protein
MLKRILSLFAIVCLLAIITPMSVFAATSVTWSGTAPTLSGDPDNEYAVTLSGTPTGTLNIPAGAHVTVSGTATASGTITFQLGTGSTVDWNASISSPSGYLNGFVHASGSGTFNFNGGNITSNNGDALNADTTTLNFNGGTLNASGDGADGIYVTSGTVNISGGSITAINRGIAADVGGTVNITGGTITGGIFAGVFNTSNSSILNISGGNISATSGVGVNGGVAHQNTNISGGTISGPSYGARNVVITGGTVTITSSDSRPLGDSNTLPDSYKWTTATSVDGTQNVQTGTAANPPDYSDNSIKYLKIEPSTDGTVYPTTADFDKYSGSPDNKDIPIALDPGRYTLSAVKNGSATLTPGTDYTVSGNTITLKKSYLSSLANGLQTITFDMDGGTDPTTALTVSDSPPQDASVDPTTADFDKYSESADNKDIPVTLDPGDYTLSAVKNDSATLTPGTDYTVSGNTITLKKSYLSSLADGVQTITFDMDGGTDPTTAVTVSDSTPQNASVSPTTATFDRAEGSAGHADIPVTLDPGDYALEAVKNGDETLVAGRDYTISDNTLVARRDSAVSDSTVTFLESYLSTLPMGKSTITFLMNGGTSPTLEITIVDSTPVPPGPSPNTGDDTHLVGWIFVSTASVLALLASLILLKKGSRKRP